MQAAQKSEQEQLNGGAHVVISEVSLTKSAREQLEQNLSLVTHRRQGSRVVAHRCTCRSAGMSWRIEFGGH